MDDLYKLPESLPSPVDDEACDHLLGLQLPSVPLSSTAERIVDLASLPGRTVVYCYTLTGKPNSNLPAGWDEIPGARGYTPQSCALLLIKRLTLIILDKQIEKVFYPVFPPNTNAEEVIEWLVHNP